MVVGVFCVPCSRVAVSGPSRWEGKVASAGVVWHQDCLYDRCHVLALSPMWCFWSFSYPAGPAWYLLSWHHGSLPPAHCFLFPLFSSTWCPSPSPPTQPLFTGKPGLARQVGVLGRNLWRQLRPYFLPWLPLNLYEMRPLPCGYSLPSRPAATYRSPCQPLQF